MITTLTICKLRQKKGQARACLAAVNRDDQAVHVHRHTPVVEEVRGYEFD